MDRQKAMKWVGALRSGKYKQGKVALEIVRKDGVKRNCCLGVACRVFRVRAKLEAADLLKQLQSPHFTNEALTLDDKAAIICEVVEDAYKHGLKDAVVLLKQLIYEL